MLSTLLSVPLLQFQITKDLTDLRGTRQGQYDTRGLLNYDTVLPGTYTLTYEVSTEWRSWARSRPVGKLSGKYASPRATILFFFTEGIIKLWQALSWQENTKQRVQKCFCITVVTYFRFSFSYGGGGWVRLNTPVIIEPIVSAPDDERWVWNIQ
jgi:hypothetical protein